MVSFNQVLDFHSLCRDVKASIKVSNVWYTYKYFPKSHSWWKGRLSQGTYLAGLWLFLYPYSCILPAQKTEKVFPSSLLWSILFPDQDGRNIIYLLLAQARSWRLQLQTICLHYDYLSSVSVLQVWYAANHGVEDLFIENREMWRYCPFLSELYLKECHYQGG